MSAGYPVQDATIDRTVYESGTAGMYKSIITNQYVTVDGSNTRHPCCPIVTTDSNGSLPDIQAQATKTNTEVNTITGTGQSGEYVVKAGLSYADYLLAIDILAKIAVGGAEVMDYDHSHLITKAEAVNQTSVITNTTVNVNGVKSAIIPMADIEKSLRPPGASTTTPEGLVAVGGDVGAAPNAILPKSDTTHSQNGIDVLAKLGGNSVQIGPDTFIPKLAVPTSGGLPTDQINKFSVPSAGRMDSGVVSNDTILFISKSGNSTGSRLFGAPVK